MHKLWNKRGLWIAGIMLLGNTPPAVATEDLPDGAFRITPEERIWKPGRVPGHEIARIVGDSTQSGPYVEHVKFPANSISKPHSHPESRMYTVLSGTWLVGYGDVFDPAKLKALPPGSFYTEPANVTHFSQIKEEDVVVQIVGNGPTATRFVPLTPAK
jgi:quercetin dioxygenase-like cupin family protein